jgi:riboflavin kinase/FMN adenylyltransferase
VWVGENFLFGRERTGTFTLLRTLGEDRGFRTEKIEPVRYKDFVVSSTRVRHLWLRAR